MMVGGYMGFIMGSIYEEEGLWRVWMCVYEEEVIAGHPGATEEYTSLELSATIHIATCAVLPVYCKLRSIQRVYRNSFTSIN